MSSLAPVPPRLRRPVAARPVAALSLGTLVLLTVAACSTGDARETVPEKAAVPVRVAPVQEEEIRRPVIATGTYGLRDEIDLSFPVGGLVAAVEVDGGDRADAGRVLARLELDEIDATLAQARSAAEKAQRDLERTGRLHRDSVVTLVQLQDARTAAEVAAAELERAAFARRHAVIRAPADGVVLERRAEPGETVSPGTPVLRFGSRGRGGVVRVGLADRDVVRLRVGDTAEATFPALPGRVFPGRVSQIAGAASPGTGTYAVEVALDDPDALVAGLVGRVEIRPDRGERAALVPVEAILEADGDDATLFVLSADGTRAERRRVRVAGLEGSRVALSLGVSSGERVLTEGAAWLTDGARVEVVR